MPASTVAHVKKGRVSRITRVHEDREVVRVEREGAEPGSEPVVEVVQQRQTRSTVNLRDGRGKNKKTLAALPAPGDSSEDAAEDEMLSTQEAEEMLSEAEELLNEPIPGKVHTTVAHHDDEAELNQPAIQSSSLEQDDASPGLGHHIEEVPFDTAHDEHDDPQVEEPESSVAATTERTAPAKSHGIIPKVQGLLSSIVHRHTGAPTEQETTSKEQTNTRAKQGPAKAVNRAGKAAKKGKQASGSKQAQPAEESESEESESEEDLEAAPEASPVKKGRAAAKRAAAPISEAQPASKKAHKSAELVTEPATPAKQPTAPSRSAKQTPGQKGVKASSSKVNKSSRSGKQKGGRQKKRAVETYRTYIYKVLKEVHPDVGISKQGMQVMNTFATDMFDRIVKEAAKLTQVSKKVTMSSREIQTAVRLLMPGELAKHAITEGAKAVNKITSEKR